MAEAIAKQRGIPNDDAVLEEATIALSAVLTNAVEVHDNEGRALGIAVFDHIFSWINHSSSPHTLKNAKAHGIHDFATLSHHSLRFCFHFAILTHSLQVSALSLGSLAFH